MCCSAQEQGNAAVSSSSWICWYPAFAWISARSSDSHPKLGQLDINCHLNSTCARSTALACARGFQPLLHNCTSVGLAAAWRFCISRRDSSWVQMMANFDAFRKFLLAPDAMRIGSHHTKNGTDSASSSQLQFPYVFVPSSRSSAGCQ